MLFAQLKIFRFATVLRMIQLQQRILNAHQGSLHLKLKCFIKIEMIENFKKDITIVLEDITVI